MRILGIDPALGITGYGIIESDQNKLSLLEAGIIKTLASKTIPERIDKIYRAVSKLISDTKPQVVVLEKLYAHYRHPTTAYILGQARGVICLVCAQKNIPLVEYGATRVKKAVIGGGQAAKYQIQKRVADILAIKNLPKYTDITDALALAIAYSYISKAAIYGAK